MAAAPRPPIVAVMGHIDHGKSSLLDYIRKSNVVADEAGGITQHVSAYEAEHPHEGAPRTITFLDTPGHEAFRALRTRGAQSADIAILVVAAEEGVKPQTLEALSAITEAGIPYVVAFTKIDKPAADLERAKVSALEHNIFLEGLGGPIPYQAISSKTGQGVPELLDLVLLAADLVGLSADPEAPAEGFVLESSQDPKRGASATLIVKNGTLEIGDFVVAGGSFAPVRFIENFLGKRIPSALPSQPVRISGFSALPSAGTPFKTAKSKKDAERMVHAAAPAEMKSSAAEAEDGKTVLPLVLKADVTGSIDAVRHELAKLSHERVVLRILDTSVGSVSESDVKTASASKGVIIAFNVGTDAIARELAERDGVPIETFPIIYELGKRVAELLSERAPRVSSEETLGEAKVLKTFSSGSKKQVLGARLLSGAFLLGNQVKILRRDVEVGRGTLTNLQMARADVKEIRAQTEFGLEIESKAEAAGGDTLIAFRVTES